MPNIRFYPLIFRHILYLQTHDKQSASDSQPAPSVVRYYSDLVGATQQEDSILLAEAETWKSEVAPIDAKAYALIDEIHARTPGGRLAPGEQPPPPPQELIDLQSEKDGITQKCIDNLRSRLGATRFTQIDRNMRRITHVTFHSAMPMQAITGRLGTEGR